MSASYSSTSLRSYLEVAIHEKPCQVLPTIALNLVELWNSIKKYILCEDGSASLYRE